MESANIEIEKSQGAFLPRLITKTLKHENILGTLVISLTILIFLSTPILNIRDSYYSAADYTQNYSLLSVHTPGYKLSNGGLSDIAVSFHPWFLYNKSQIANGKIPLWNPYNGNGLPYLGNYESVIFSPFNFPFYVLTFRQALIVSAFMKLFVLGFFTFLFLKKLGVAQYPALIGGIAFMYSGYNVVWLSLVITNTDIMIPTSLYFVESIFQKYSKGAHWQDLFLSLVGLSLSIAIGLLGGHPETFYFSFLILLSFIVFRLANELWRQKNRWKQLLILALQLNAAGLIGAALTAFQLIPFVEYLSSSMIINGSGSGTVGLSTLSVDTFPLLVFSNLLGNPTTDYYMPGYDYSTFNEHYIGSIMVLMAILSLLFIKANKYIAFFSGLTFAWFIYSFNILGLGNIFRVVPGITIVNILRSQPIWSFSVCILGSLYINHIYSGKLFNENKAKKLIGLLPISLAGIGLLLLGLLGGQKTLEKYYSALQPVSDKLKNYLPSQIWFIGLTFCAGILLICLCRVISSTRLKMGANLALLLVVFLQSGFLLKDYNPTIKDTYFYPQTPAIKELVSILGTNHSLAIVGWDTVPPSLNMVYGFSMINNYDAIEVKEIGELGRQLFGRYWPINIDRINEKAMKLFGVEYLIQQNRHFSLDTGLSDEQYLSKKLYQLPELLPGVQFSQTFIAKTDDLREIMVAPATFQKTSSCTLNIKLEQMPEKQRIQEISYPCKDLEDGNAIFFKTAPVKNSANKTFRITITSPDSQPGNAISLWAKSDLIYEQGSLTINEQVQAGGLNFNYYSGDTKNFIVEKPGSLPQLYRYTKSPTRYYSLNTAVFAANDAQAMQLVLGPDFDPSSAVILTGTSPKITQSTADVAVPAQIVKEEDTDIVLKVNRQQPGYLVMSRTYFPGWKVKVNGETKPLLKANYAFNAVEVGAGESNVEFYYEPDSFKYGLLISGVTLVLILTLIGWWLITKKQRNF